VALAGVHDIMARAEDVLLDGERSDRLEVVRGDALVTAYELDDRLIAFVRDYDEPGEVTLRLVGTAVWVVRDMDSGARVERLTAGRREFTLDLADGNSRVIECAPH